MNSVDNGDKVGKVVRCEHVKIELMWVRNDGDGAPELYIGPTKGPVIVALTNQVLYANCPECFRGVWLQSRNS